MQSGAPLLQEISINYCLFVLSDVIFVCFLVFSLHTVPEQKQSIMRLSRTQKNSSIETDLSENAFSDLYYSRRKRFNGLILIRHNFFCVKSTDDWLLLIVMVYTCLTPSFQVKFALLVWWMHFVTSRFCNQAFLFWPPYAYVFVRGEGANRWPNDDLFLVIKCFLPCIPTEPLLWKRGQRGNDCTLCRHTFIVQKWEVSLQYLPAYKNLYLRTC